MVLAALALHSAVAAVVLPAVVVGQRMASAVAAACSESYAAGTAGPGAGGAVTEVSHAALAAV